MSRNQQQRTHSHWKLILIYIVVVTLVNLCLNIVLLKNVSDDVGEEDLDFGQLSESDYENWAKGRGRHTLSPRRHFYESGNYGILADFIVGEEEKSGSKNKKAGITLCIHSGPDYHHPDFYTLIPTTPEECNFGSPWDILEENLLELIEQWNGPTSLTLYTPGHDFYEALSMISFLQNCIGTLEQRDLLRRWVSFHFIFDLIHWPTTSSNVIRKDNTSFRNSDWNHPLMEMDVDKYLSKHKGCEARFMSSSSSYRKMANLSYPINLARNVARLKAHTFYTISLDLETKILEPNLHGSLSSFLAQEILEKNYHHRNEVWILPSKETSINISVVGGRSLTTRSVGNDDKLRGWKVPSPEHNLEVESSGGINLKLKTGSTPNCHPPGLKCFYEEYDPSIISIKDSSTMDSNTTTRTTTWRLDQSENYKWSTDFVSKDFSPIFIANQNLPLFDEGVILPLSNPPSRRCFHDTQSLLFTMCLLDYKFLEIQRQPPQSQSHDPIFVKIRKFVNVSKSTVLKRKIAAVANNTTPRRRRRRTTPCGRRKMLSFLTNFRRNTLYSTQILYGFKSECIA